LFDGVGVLVEERWEKAKPPVTKSPSMSPSVATTFTLGSSWPLL
jgi:hypothetical protein